MKTVGRPCAKSEYKDQKAEDVSRFLRYNNSCLLREFPIIDFLKRSTFSGHLIQISATFVHA